jgi:hypothetical protein
MVLQQQKYGAISPAPSWFGASLRTGTTLIFLKEI